MVPPVDSILAVDDDELNLGVLRRIFGAAGFRVRTVERGELAIEELAAERPAAMLLDLHMPGMDGLEVLRQMRGRESVPVIVLTGSGDIGAAVEAIKLGAYDFVVRPVSPEVLVLIVQRAIQASRMTAEIHALRAELAEVRASRSRRDTPTDVVSLPGAKLIVSRRWSTAWAVVKVLYAVAVGVAAVAVSVIHWLHLAAERAAQRLLP